MLNIPDEVKALLKRDGVYKNFHVHFPNGELQDLNNENVVQESVKFSESICSQDVLKFGLTESSAIEFETVGVGNMYGLTIECGLDIDLSSLTAAQIADIESGTWDGEFIPAADAPTGLDSFRIPYGLFVVDSCPRDHQAMAHRKVQAFTISPKRALMNPVEDIKLRSFFGGNVYNPNLYYLMLSALGWQDPQILLDDGFAEGTEVNYFSGSQDRAGPKKTVVQNATDIHGNFYTITLTISRAYGYNTTSGGSVYQYDLSEALYAVHMNFITEEHIETMIADMATALENHGKVDLEATGFSSYRELAEAMITDRGNDPDCIYPSLEARSYPTTTASSVTETKGFSYIFKSDNYAVYPKADNGKMNSTGGGGSWYGGGSIKRTRMYFLTPLSIQLVDGSATTMSDRVYQLSFERPRMYKYERNEAVPDMRLKLGSTLEKKVGTTDKMFSFYNSYSLLDMVNGWLELRAMFGKMQRDGKMAVYRLSKDNAVPVLPNEYSGFWWDEYDVDAIGTIRYSFTTGSDVASSAVYNFGSGKSVYDISDNKVLEKLGLTDAASVEAYLDELFIPHLSPIAFTPIDMQMKGLPYLEAGDYIAVTAEDGTIINSFNMRHEIDGIQVLSATVESVNGDIIEPEEYDGQTS